MPSPITPSDVEGDLPATSYTVCERLIHTVPFFEKLRTVNRYFFTDQATFSQSFIDDLCLLGCIRGITPAASCQAIVLTGTAYGRNGAVDLTFTGTNLTDGWTWTIYRKVHGGAYSSSLATGTTGGSVVTYTDSTAVNDQLYVYKCVVTKADCGTSYNTEVEAMASVCESLNPTLELSSPVTGSIQIKIVGLRSGIPIRIWQSISEDQMGSEISLSASPEYTYVDAGLDPYQEYYYTIYAQQDAACDRYTLRGHANPTSATLSAPVVRMQGRNLYIDRVQGDVKFRIAFKAHNSCSAVQDPGPPDSTNAWSYWINSFIDQASSGDTQVVLDPVSIPSTVGDDGWCYSIAVKAYTLDAKHESPWSATVMWKHGACV